MSGARTEPGGARGARGGRSAAARCACARCAVCAARCARCCRSPSTRSPPPPLTAHRKVLVRLRERWEAKCREKGLLNEPIKEEPK